MSAHVFTFPVPVGSKNQALANLYRVEAELARAGVAGDYGRGSADDGAPWLAVCEPETGDVIVHVAVIDGLVVADSPALPGPLRGRDVAALLRRLVSGLMAQPVGNHSVLLALIAALTVHHVVDSPVVADDAQSDWSGAVAALVDLPVLVVVAGAGAALARQAVEMTTRDAPPAVDVKPVSLEQVDAAASRAIEHHAAVAPELPRIEITTPPVAAPDLPAAPFHLQLPETVPAPIALHLEAPAAAPVETPTEAPAVLAEPGPMSDPFIQKLSTLPPLPDGQGSRTEMIGTGVVMHFDRDEPYRQYVFLDGSTTTVVGLVAVGQPEIIYMPI